MNSRQFEWIGALGFLEMIGGIYIAIGVVLFILIPKQLDKRIVDGRVTSADFWRKLFYEIGGVAFIAFGELLFLYMTFFHTLLRGY